MSEFTVKDYYSAESGDNIAQITYHGKVAQHVRVWATKATFEQALRDYPEHKVTSGDTSSFRSRLTLEEFKFIYIDAVGVAVEYDDDLPVHWHDFTG